MTSPGKKQDESTYISSIVDSLMIYCRHMKDDFLYIPIIELKFTTKSNEEFPKETIDFFNNVFKYFKDQRICVKPDDTTRNIHLFITSDNTPIDDLNDDKALGYNMQDMKTVEEVAIALSNYRKKIYQEWNQVSKDDVNLMVKDIFTKFQDNTRQVITNTKPSIMEIKAPATLIDPITLGGFPSEMFNERIVIKQSSVELQQSSDFQQLIYLASIYGINQLLNVWIDNTKIVNTYNLESMRRDNEKVDIINFQTTTKESFLWSIGDTTVNVICGCLINIRFNMIKQKYNYNTIINENILTNLINVDTEFGRKVQLKYPDCKERWIRLYNISKIIINDQNYRFSRTIQEFMMIISYLKSCGDEYQRLTCEFLNYIISSNRDDTYLLSYLPGVTELPTSNSLEILQGIIFLLTKDRILIGESVEKNTPIYTFLQTPNTAFYDDIEQSEQFYIDSTGIKGPDISKKNSGVLTNRRTQLSAPIIRNYNIEVPKNKANIKNLIKEILLKLLDEPEYQIINLDELYLKAIPDIEEYNDDYSNKQENIIEILTKIGVSLSYFIQKINPKERKDIYESMLNSEIMKAVSMTVNSNMLEDIQLKNSCRIPRTVGNLNTLIQNMYNDPEIVDKLIESYETANELCCQKITTYINIFENLNTNELNIITQFGINNTMITGLIVQYNEYIDDINENKETFSKKIFETIDQYLQAEIRKSTRTRLKTKTSYADVSEEQENLNNVVEALNKRESQRQQLLKEQEKISLELAEEQKETEKKPKTFIKKILGQFKKRTSAIAKDISKITSSINNILKQKTTYETKIAGKTKVFGLETYKKMMDMLKRRRNLPTTGGGKVYKKTKKYKTKKYKTKKYKTKRLLKKIVKCKQTKNKKIKHKKTKRST